MVTLEKSQSRLHDSVTSVPVDKGIIGDTGQHLLSTYHIRKKNVIIFFWVVYDEYFESWDSIWLIS